jgi:mono/diheme cytochrome c family protein
MIGTWRGVALALLMAPGAAAAQSADWSHMTAQQRLGFRLFTTDCGVCHSPPTITSKLYGPALTGDLVTGNEAAIHQFISQGDAKMPGFQYYYSPAQIDAVVAYLATRPKAPAAAANAQSDANASKAPAPAALRQGGTMQ